MESVEKNDANTVRQRSPVMIKGVILRTVARAAKIMHWRQQRSSRNEKAKTFNANWRGRTRIGMSTSDEHWKRTGLKRRAARLSRLSWHGNGHVMTMWAETCWIRSCQRKENGKDQRGGIWMWWRWTWERGRIKTSINDNNNKFIFI